MIICKKCGNGFDEKYDVCPKCGMVISQSEQKAQYTYIMPAQMSMSLADSNKIKKKTNVKLITIISVSIVVIIGIIVALIMLFSQPNKQAQIDEQISLGEKYLTEENYEEAIIAFKKAIEIEPNDPDLYIKLADAYIAKGDNNNAIKALENGYKQTDDEKIKKKLDELKTQVEYEKLMSDGEKALSEKNYDEAIKKFEKAIELKPTEVEPYISVADSYIGNKNNDSAKVILEKGYEKTNSAEIKKKLDELNKIIEKEKAEKAKKEAEEYKNNIIDAVLNSESEWARYMISDMYFVDTNFDGKLEFITNYYLSTSSSRGGQVYLLSNGKLSECGYIIEHNLKTYYNSDTNEYKLFGSRYVHESVAEHSEMNIEYSYKNDELVGNTYSSMYYSNYTGTPNIVYYDENSKPISESEYNKINSEKVKGYIDANMKYSSISYYEFKNMSTSEKREALEKSYDEFIYDKY